MKTSTLVLIFALMGVCAPTVLAAEAPKGVAFLGFPKADSEKTLRADFRTPPPGYGEVPFWWWTGDKLNKQRLLEQIEALHAAGVSGMQINYAHRRQQGWPTEIVDPPIFSDAWWDVVNFVAEECAKRQMGIGLSGYTLDWPGCDNLYRQLGIADAATQGHDISCRSFTHNGGAVAPTQDEGVVSVAAFPRTGGEPVLLSAQGGTLPKGTWDIRVVTTHPMARTFDPLNPLSAQRVIEKFLNPFLTRLSPLGRTALNYFFQDELRLAGDLRIWCPDFADEFQKRKGYDIRPYLYYLFGGEGPRVAQVRLDYNDVQMALTEERYFQPIYNWHASRGLIYACDPASRGRNPMEFGDYMRCMKWYTAPGFDTPGTSADVIKNKVGSSIAHLNRRPRVWLEGYHSQGWQASTETIFNSSVHNFVYGASLFNLHGLYYSTYGGWWEWAPPCYHFRMPYWQHMPYYLKYFERLSYALTQGAHQADVAIVHPIEPLVLDRGRGGASVGLSHAIVGELVTRRSVDVDFIDGASLAKAEIRNGRLEVAGESYRAIVLPNMYALRSASWKKLAAFKQAGGVVAAFGQLPQASDVAPDGARALPGAEQIVSAKFSGKPSAEEYAKFVTLLGTRDFTGPAGTKVLHRKVGAYHLYFLVDLPEKATCTFRAQGAAEIWNPWTGTQTACAGAQANADGTTTLTLEPNGQPVLVAFTSDGGRAGRAPLPDSSATSDSSAARAGRGTRPACPHERETLKLDGAWAFTLVPTMDNKWGDFRLPATQEKIGAEIRRFKSDLPGAEAYQTVEFGPQFRDVKTGKLHSFAWRWGEENRPTDQNFHHGLNRKVGDDFFTLGPYDWGWSGFYNVVPRGPKPDATYETFVYAPCACPAKIVAHGVAPQAITLDGKPVKAGDAVTLAAGYHPLRVHYAGTFGRAALVVQRCDIVASPSTVPLSSRWYDDPSILKFDPFGGKVTTTRFTATLPPAFRAAKIELNGTLESATVAGRPAKIVAPTTGHVWSVIFDGPTTVLGAELVLTVKPQPGVMGCGVFRDPVALTCGTGTLPLGDWACVDGLWCYSGGATYEKTVTLTAEQAKKGATLDLGRVSATCEVSVNGSQPQILCTPPWKVDVTGLLKPGANRVKVTVYNTLNNHYQTIPSRYKRATKDAPSGLLGPVTLGLR